jgi:hypothetical protein
VGDTNNGVYVTASGVVTKMTYNLNATINAGTASRIAYYSGANAISSGSIVTDGGYLGSVSYLSVNTAHQTSYRAYINGSSYLVGETIHGSNVRSDTTRTDYLGTSSYYWKGAYIHGDGDIHWNNLVKVNSLTITTTDTNRGLPRILMGNDTNINGRGSQLWGMSPASVLVETSSNGTTWTINTALTDT